MSKKDLLAGMLAAIGDDSDTFSGGANPAELKERFSKFAEKHTFKPGDIVQWKPGMCHKKTKGPFIVIEVLTEPIFDGQSESGSTYFREPLTLVLGTMVRDDFTTFYFDGRRMEPYKEE